jgi:5-methylcytosine-specific restriction endonuclease McrA
MPRRGQEFTWDDFPAYHGKDGWHCRFCKKVLTGLKRAWCSSDCLREVRSRCDWNYIRNKVRRRDRWRCQWLMADGTICGQRGTDVDHIIELADGGSFWKLENLRLLCCPHHKTKTVMSRRARAERKKLAKKSA